MKKNEGVLDVLRSLTKRDVTVIVFAVLLGFLGGMATDLYLPAMPQMALALAASKSQVQHTVSVLLLGCVFSQPVYGALADRYGRKIILIIGLSVTVIGFIMAMLATSIDMLLWARLLQGIGIGASMPLFRSLICDVVSGKRLVIVLSYGTMLFSLSPIISPAMGGYITHYLSWRFCFALLLLVYLIYMLAFWIWCPETQPDVDKISMKLGKLFGYYRELFTDKVFLLASLCGGVGFAVIMAYVTSTAFIFQRHFTLTPIQFGWLGIVLGGASIYGKQLNAKLSLRIRISTLMLFGCCLILGSGVLLLLFMHNRCFLSALLPILLAVIGLSFLMGNAMVLAMNNFAHIRGIAGSMYGMLQMAVAVITSAVVAHFAAYYVLTLALAYVTLAIFGVIMAGVLFYFRRSFNYR